MVSISGNSKICRDKYITQLLKLEQKKRSETLKCIEVEFLHTLMKRMNFEDFIFRKKNGINQYLINLYMSNNFESLKFRCNRSNSCIQKLILQMNDFITLNQVLTYI